jgi:hypothetical protein
MRDITPPRLSNLMGWSDFDAQIRSSQRFAAKAAEWSGELEEPGLRVERSFVTRDERSWAHL